MSETDEKFKKMESFREVPRKPECCGKPMQRLTGVSPTSGNVVAKVICEKCGKQETA